MIKASVLTVTAFAAAEPRQLNKWSKWNNHQITNEIHSIRDDIHDNRAEMKQLTQKIKTARANDNMVRVNNLRDKKLALKGDIQDQRSDIGDLKFERSFNKQFMGLPGYSAWWSRIGGAFPWLGQFGIRPELLKCLVRSSCDCRSFMSANMALQCYYFNGVSLATYQTRTTVQVVRERFLGAGNQWMKANKNAMQAWNALSNGNINKFNNKWGQYVNHAQKATQLTWNKALKNFRPIQSSFFLNNPFLSTYYHNFFQSSFNVRTPVYMNDSAACAGWSSGNMNYGLLGEEGLALSIKDCFRFGTVM